jgi:glycosyltransferase involved in cell wall biosynthesis
MGKLPRALMARWRWRGRHEDWVKLLRPAGSVPVITLPVPPRSASAGEGAAAAPLPDATWASARALAASSSPGRNVLVLGWAPLPFENARMNYAPGGRTWQLARPLAADGHRVCVVCAPMPGAYEGATPRVREATRDGVLVYWLERELFDSPAVLAELVRLLEPEVLVGATALPSLRAVRLAGGRPVWVDLFGDPMAEAQARALTGAEGEPLGAYRDLLAELLDRGDAFSAVSERQRWAALGQLGLAGRLNWATAGTELVSTIPCAVEARPVGGDRPPRPGISSDDFVVLWSGGYNTWCDVETLALGVRAAMAANPRVRFVSTGDAVAGHDDATYRRWVDLVEASASPDRYHMLGALPADEAEQWRRRADLALVTERPIVERALGSSGRVAGWLSAGLPVACTSTSELGEWLARHDVALIYPPGDGDALARLILDAALDPERVRRMGERARALAVAEFSPERSTEPLRSWVHAASRAPDAGRGNPISLLADERAAEWQARYHEVRGELGRIHQSRMWRLWMLSLRVRGALGAPLRWVRSRAR